MTTVGQSQQLLVMKERPRWGLWRQTTPTVRVIAPRREVHSETEQSQHIPVQEQRHARDPADQGCDFGSAQASRIPG